MLAILYLVLAWVIGRLFFRAVLGHLIRPLFNRPGSLLPEWVVREPVAWVSGTLALSWIVYLSAWAFRSIGSPLLWGNLFGAVAGLTLLIVFRRTTIPDAAESPSLPRGVQVAPILLAVTVTLGFGALCYQALWVRDGQVGAGLSVFSDYGPHLAVMRSFSLGDNFPTEYPHYPDGTARYHFLFQFLAGNLEYLGLRIDWALNVPSVLAFTSASLLLYALATGLTHSVAGGLLTVYFFCFRSGLAGWDFVLESGGWWESWPRFWTNSQFIGRTTHEDWGLWNQNVYLNQRHLALGLSVLFFALLNVYARLTLAEPLRRSLSPWRRLFSRPAWLPGHPSHLLAMGGLGALIGLCGFWNGAAVIATLLILAVLGLFVLHRLELLTLAAVAGALCFAENRFFLGPGALAVEPEIVLGFLAERPVTWATVGVFLIELLGPQPLLVLLAFLGCAVTARYRSEDEGGSVRAKPWPWFVAFLAPLLLAFTVRLTPDVAINHKYVMIAVILSNAFVAAFLVALWRWAVVLRPVALFLAFALTLTGWVDLRTIINKNQREAAMTANLRDPAHQWIIAHTRPQDRLLTDWYSFHTLLLTGRKIFYGWPYYAWGAGYDTLAREAIVKQIYGGTDFDTTLRLLRENKIAYVVIDDGNRKQSLYKLQEGLLRERLTEVYTSPEYIILKVP